MLVKTHAKTPPSVTMAFVVVHLNTTTYFHLKAYDLVDTNGSSPTDGFWCNDD